MNDYDRLIKFFKTFFKLIKEHQLISTIVFFGYGLLIFILNFKYDLPALTKDELFYALVTSMVFFVIIPIFVIVGAFVFCKHMIKKKNMKNLIIKNIFHPLHFGLFF